MVFSGFRPQGAGIYYEDIRVEHDVYMWDFDTEARTEADKNGKPISITDI